MASTSTCRLLRPSLASSQSDAVLSFLVPSIRCARFSTSPALQKKDNNSNRGVSAVRRTGLRARQTLSVRQKDFENQQLPTPVKVEEKVVPVNGELEIRKRMNLSLSCDHRVVDGWDAASFVQGLKKYLETPVLLFAD